MKTGSLEKTEKKLIFDLPRSLHVSFALLSILRNNLLTNQRVRCSNTFLYRICGLFIHRFSVFEDVESSSGVPLSGLASSSVENLRHMTCGTTRGCSSNRCTKEVSNATEMLQEWYRRSACLALLLPQWKPCVIWLAVRKISRDRACSSTRCISYCVFGDGASILPALSFSGLASFLSGDLVSNELLFEKDREKLLATPDARIYFGDDVVDCPGGPAFFLQWRDLRHKTCGIRKISRRLQSVMSPNVVDYLLVIKNSN